jgi:hypothetical protein
MYCILYIRYMPYYFEFKKNPTFTNGFFRQIDRFDFLHVLHAAALVVSLDSIFLFFLCDSTNFASKYISMSVKFTTLSARPLLPRWKLCFRYFRRVKNNTSNFRRTLIFFSGEKMWKNLRLKFDVIEYKYLYRTHDAMEGQGMRITFEKPQGRRYAHEVNHK